ncbi:hypothetical protein F5Y03DRAFT_391598 [Xylaria venustula]|nr:hypothetical protein F5Y03DRAFT_391598 [Xylaria venustula]
MAPRPASSPDHRINLAHALGCPDYPGNSKVEPYLNYITNNHVSRGTLEEYLQFFIRVIKHFEGDGTGEVIPTQNSVQVLLDKLVASKDEKMFGNTEVGSEMREKDVEDTVITAFAENLAGLIRGSGLLPAPRNPTDLLDDNPDEIVQILMKLAALLAKPKDTTSDSSVFEKFGSKMPQGKITYRSLDNMDSLESLSIKATRLNAYTLNTLGAVEVFWTHNVSHHMRLSQHSGRYFLKMFALPCAFGATSLTSDAVGISPKPHT